MVRDVGLVLHREHQVRVGRCFRKITLAAFQGVPERGSSEMGPVWRMRHLALTEDRVMGPPTHTPNWEKVSRSEQGEKPAGILGSCGGPHLSQRTLAARGFGQERGLDFSEGYTLMKWRFQF